MFLITVALFSCLILKCIFIRKLDLFLQPGLVNAVKINRYNGPTLCIILISGWGELFSTKAISYFLKAITCIRLWHNSLSYCCSLRERKLKPDYRKLTTIEQASRNANYIFTYFVFWTSRWYRNETSRMRLLSLRLGV